MEVVGAGAAGATMVSAYGYNRDAWMTNLLLGQGRNYQKQQLLLSQAVMFREDMRQLISSSVARQNNFVIVLTLVLSMMENFYISVALPSGTPNFLWVAFLLCIGSSLVYLMLAVVFTIWGNHLAVSCQAELLTALVRLPITDLSAELLEQAPDESTEAFERQPARRMLRLPLLGAARPKAGRRASSGGPGSRVAPMQDGSPQRRARSAEPPAKRPKGPVDAVRSMEARRDEQVQELLRRKQQWHALGGHTVVFGYLGLSALLHAFSYFTVAKTYQGKSFWWCAGIMQGLLTVMVCALSFLFGGYRRVKAHKSLRVVSAILELGGQLSMFLAVRIRCPHWLHLVCALSCFCCHLTVNIVILYSTYVRGKLLSSSMESSRRAKDTSTDKMGDSASDTTSATDESAAEGPTLKRARRHSVALLSSAIVTMAWALSTAWFLHYTVRGLQTDKFATTCSGGGIAWYAPAGPSSRRRLHGGLDTALSVPEVGDAAALNTSITLLRERLVHAKQQRHRLELKMEELGGALGAEQDPHGLPPLMATMADLVRRIDAGLYQ